MLYLFRTHGFRRQTSLSCSCIVLTEISACEIQKNIPGKLLKCKVTKWGAKYWVNVSLLIKKSFIHSCRQASIVRVRKNVPNN